MALQTSAFLLIVLNGHRIFTATSGSNLALRKCDNKLNVHVDAHPSVDTVPSMAFSELRIPILKLAHKSNCSSVAGGSYPVCRSDGKWVQENHLY